VAVPLKHLAVGVLVAVAVLVGGVLYPMWRAAVDRNLDARADPYHIAGDLYFVGSPATTSFLLLGPKGHVLIDGGGERDARKILDNIEQLGFNARDVRILLATDAGLAAAGGFAGLQKATGAELWVSNASADVIASGGKKDPNAIYLPFKLFARAGITDYPPPRVDHRFEDGEVIHLGPLAVTAHVPDRVLGCTTWTFTVRDRGRDLRVVHRCNLTVPYRASLVEPQQYPGIRADFEQTFDTLRKLPVDIWLTSEGREYGRFRKYQESLHADDPAAPFIDPNGYLESINRAEAAFRTLLAEQERAKR
jgi:metallo-beta-lactamase class B